MLYELGIILLFLSVMFVGGSVLVPVTIAAAGLALMMMGKEAEDGKKTRV